MELGNAFLTAGADCRNGRKPMPNDIAALNTAIGGVLGIARRSNPTDRSTAYRPLLAIS